MGNLYTNVHRHNNRRLEILQRLRQLWQSNPQDYKEINKLQKELQYLDNNGHKYPKNRTEKRIYKDSFGGTYTI